MVRDVLAPLAHPTWGKLQCVVWMWFKDFDGFLTGGQFMA
jgi:hypothetical protein